MQKKYPTLIGDARGGGGRGSCPAEIEKMKNFREKTTWEGDPCDFYQILEKNIKGKQTGINWSLDSTMVVHMDGSQEVWV